MKIIAAIISTLTLADMAYAAESKTIDYVIFSNQKYDKEFESWGRRSFFADATSTCKEMVEFTYISDSLEKRSNWEYECEKIQPKLIVNYSTGKIDEGLFGNKYKQFRFHLNIYCTPRSLAQKQIISLYRTCEIDPKKECFSPQYLKYLETLKLTSYEPLDTLGCNDPYKDY